MLLENFQGYDGIHVGMYVVATTEERVAFFLNIMKKNGPQKDVLVFFALGLKFFIGKATIKHFDYVFVCGAIIEGLKVLPFFRENIFNNSVYLLILRFSQIISEDFAYLTLKGFVVLLKVLD